MNPTLLLSAAGLLMVTLSAQKAVDQPPETARSTMNLPTGFVFKSLTHEGREFKYVLYVPREYDPGRAWPALVFLHGKGECGTDGQKHIGQGIGTNIIWHADRWPFVVIMPQKPDENAPWETFDGAVLAMLAATQRAYSIDSDRIALTGLSQGGHGTWALGAAHPDVWSALVPICGYAAPLAPADIAAKVKGLPIWCFHGETDTAVAPEKSREILAALEAAGVKPKATFYPETGHNSWDKAYAEPELPGWLLAQKRAAR